MTAVCARALAMISWPSALFVGRRACTNMKCDLSRKTVGAMHACAYFACVLPPPPPRPCSEDQEVNITRTAVGPAGAPVALVRRRTVSFSRRYEIAHTGTCLLGCPSDWAPVEIDTQALPFREAEGTVYICSQREQ